MSGDFPVSARLAPRPPGFLPARQLRWLIRRASKAEGRTCFQVRPPILAYRLLADAELTDRVRRVARGVKLVGEVVHRRLFVLQCEREIAAGLQVIDDFARGAAERHVVALDLMQLLHTPELATAVIEFHRRNLPRI